MDRTKKAEAIQILREKLVKASSIMVFDYCGLTVEEVTSLRREFRKNLVEYKVIKNTLGRLALKGTLFENVTKYLKDTTALAFCEDDPTMPARVAVAFIKNNEKLKIRGGVLPGTVLTPEEVKKLATLPSKQEVRASLLSMFVSSQRNLLGVLTASQRNMLGVLNAYKEKAAA